MEGLEGNRLFGAFAVGDVARYARGADEAVGGGGVLGVNALRAENRDDHAIVEMARALLLVLQPDFKIDRRALADAPFVEGVMRPLHVVLVDDDRVVLIDEFFRLEAKQRLDARIDEDEMSPVVDGVDQVR